MVISTGYFNSPKWPLGISCSSLYTLYIPLYIWVPNSTREKAASNEVNAQRFVRPVMTRIESSSCELKSQEVECSEYFWFCLFVWEHYILPLYASGNGIPIFLRRTVLPCIGLSMLYLFLPVSVGKNNSWMGGLRVVNIWVTVRKFRIFHLDFGSHWTNLNIIRLLVLGYFLFAKEVNLYFVFDYYEWEGI